MSGDFHEQIVREMTVVAHRATPIVKEYFDACFIVGVRAGGGMYVHCQLDIKSDMGTQGEDAVIALAQGILRRRSEGGGES